MPRELEPATWCRAADKGARNLCALGLFGWSQASTAAGNEFGAEFHPKISCPSSQPLVNGLKEVVSIPYLYLAQAQGLPPYLEHSTCCVPSNEQAESKALMCHLASPVRGQFCQGLYWGCIQSQIGNIKFWGAGQPSTQKSSIKCLNFSCIQWRPIK